MMWCDAVTSLHSERRLEANFDVVGKRLHSRPVADQVGNCCRRVNHELHRTKRTIAAQAKIVHNALQYSGRTYE